MFSKVYLLFLFFYCSHSQELTTNYEYYTSGGIKTGLIAEGKYLTLNGKEIRILSGFCITFEYRNSTGKIGS
jgi:hypothetical protein